MPSGLGTWDVQWTYWIKLGWSVDPLPILSGYRRWDLDLLVDVCGHGRCGMHVGGPHGRSGWKMDVLSSTALDALDVLKMSYGLT